MKSQPAILAESARINLWSQPWVFLAASGTALWVLNAVWLAMDTRPPVWDMAMHQSYALHYVPGFPVPAGLRFWELSGNYPPLVHIFIAVAFWLFHPSPDVAAFANLPATFVLLWSVLELGRYFASISAARWACILGLLTPYLIWMSRETILDYWLSAWVVAAWALLVRSQSFESRSSSRWFGIVCGLGLLTKWLFAYALVPALWIAVRKRIWRQRDRLANAMEALIIAAAVAAVWYLPNLRRLSQYFSANAQVGALEGEPPIFSFQSWIYYVRLLEGYQLYALLFLLLIAGVAFVFIRRAFRDPLLWTVFIASGWLLVTLLRTKDPRFTMPLLFPLLLAPGALLASWQQSRAGRIVRMCIVLVLAAQAYACNFGISWLPQQVTIVHGYQGSLRWDWQIFSQHYFGILGDPRRENWRQEEIIQKVVSEASYQNAQPVVTLVPDLPRFDTANFTLAANLAELPLLFGHTASATGGTDAFQGYDFVIVTDKEQGMSWTTPAAATLTQVVRSDPAMFKLIESYGLPNGDTAHLYFIDRGRTEK